MWENFVSDLDTLSEAGMSLYRVIVRDSEGNVVSEKEVLVPDCCGPEEFAERLGRLRQFGYDVEVELIENYCNGE